MSTSWNGLTNNYHNTTKLCTRQCIIPQQTKGQTTNNNYQKRRHQKMVGRSQHPICDKKDIKKTLLEKLHQHRPMPLYLTDEAAKQHGHTVLHLPVAHCELNPIELAWKGYVGRKAWICTICGLLCAKRGSALCATIHGLSAQSVDCAIHCAQSTDLQAIHDLARAYCGSAKLSLLL